MGDNPLITFRAGISMTLKTFGQRNKDMASAASRPTPAPAKTGRPFLKWGLGVTVALLTLVYFSKDLFERYTAPRWADEAVTAQTPFHTYFKDKDFSRPPGFLALDATMMIYAGAKACNDTPRAKAAWDRIPKIYELLLLESSDKASISVVEDAFERGYEDLSKNLPASFCETSYYYLIHDHKIYSARIADKLQVSIAQNEANIRQLTASQESVEACMRHYIAYRFHTSECLRLTKSLQGRREASP